MYKYYLKNIHWGLIIFGIAVYLTRDDFNEAKTKIFLVISFFNCLLFPFAKRGQFGYRELLYGKPVF